MPFRRIIFYLFAAFIAGTLVLVFVWYNSIHHVNGLISSNKKLMDEFQITMNLLDGSKSKVIVERKIRGFIESADTSYLAGLSAEFDRIDSSLIYLRTISDDSTTVVLVHQLDRFFQFKVDLFRRILYAYHQHGVKAGEDTINANLPLWVSYDIENTISKINLTRRHQLTAITEAAQKSSRIALRLSSILIALVLLITGLRLWYIIYIMKKLVRSEKKVKETAQIKEKFLANMSHEIRTPMNAIVGFAHLLSQNKLDDESKEYIQAIEKSGENLLAIVNDILDISKIEAGMMRIEKVPFSLRGLVNSVETMILTKAVAKDIQLNTQIESSIPDILEGDPVRLTQILNNLLSNALKFTSEGSVLLKIDKQDFFDNTVTLKMEIRDTGIGIESQQLRHIFGRFEQADDTITRQYGGTGLGLSIVKDLVELQNGSIKVESIPGNGTVFSVFMPYNVSTSKIVENLATREFLNIDATYSNTTILVTEDNEFNQSLLSHIFRKWNLHFDIVNNGSEAIEKLKTNKYDLILMDIQMPVMDGYTAAREIRNELRLDIPIIAMTAHAMPGEREKCLSYGMNEYVAKPIKQEQLRQLISRFISFIQPATKYENEKIEPISNHYKYIHLEYINEVSSGNRKYEKEITQKFLNVIPVEMKELENSVNQGNKEKMKKVAHNLKTTISVMGLNEVLNPLLDEIESGKANFNHYKETIIKINQICKKAVIEAQEFLVSLS